MSNAVIPDFKEGDKVIYGDPNQSANFWCKGVIRGKQDLGTGSRYGIFYIVEVKESNVNFQEETGYSCTLFLGIGLKEDKLSRA